MATTTDNDAGEPSAAEPRPAPTAQSDSRHAADPRPTPTERGDSRHATDPRPASTQSDSRNAANPRRDSLDAADPPTTRSDSRGNKSETAARNEVNAEASALRLNLATLRVLVTRDLKRFFRQRSRVVGALVQPLIFWLVIGSGLQGSFRMPGHEGLGYMQYFFPGIVMLVVLFTSIFTTMSVIEDRHKGFLQAVLVAPAARPSLVLGKTLGGVAIAMVQAALFLALMPLGGFDPRLVDWPLAFGILFFASVGLAALGFAIAWWLDSTQGYHVVMSVLLIPLWILSGAMFPPGAGPSWIGYVMRVNPMAYGVSGIRRALGGGAAALPGSSALLELVVLGGFAVLAVALATIMCSRRSKP